MSPQFFFVWQLHTIEGLCSAINWRHKLQIFKNLFCFHDTTCNCYTDFEWWLSWAGMLSQSLFRSCFVLSGFVVCAVPWGVAGYSQHGIIIMVPGRRLHIKTTVRCVCECVIRRECRVNFNTKQIVPCQVSFYLINPCQIYAVPKLKYSIVFLHDVVAANFATLTVYCIPSFLAIIMW